MKRLWFLYEAPTLNDVPSQKPFRRHELKGEMKGQFAVDIEHPMRLIFVPDHNPIPKKEDGDLTPIQRTHY